MAVTADWQLAYNGLDLGDTTSFDLVDIEGLGIPAVNGADLELIGRDGLHPGVDRLGGRFFELSFEVDDAPTNLAAFGAAFAPVDPEGDPSELPLVFQIPGVAGGGIRRILCRTRAAATPIGLQRNRSDIAEVIVPLAATDPRIYAETESSDSTGLPAGSNGLTWPLTWPLVWGVTTSGALVLNNAGNFRTSPVLKIDGPVTNPRIANLTRDKAFEITIVVASGDHLLVDMAARTVLLNGTANRYGNIKTGSEWWSLAAGNNNVTFQAFTTGSATLTVTWRSAWIM